MELADWIQKKRDALRGLSPLQIRNLTPSLRDFTQATSTQRRGLSVVAEIARATPEEGSLADEPNAQALCAIAEETSISALAVAIDSVVCRGSIKDLEAVASAWSGPVLARDLVLSREQIYQVRLSGGDAVLLTAGAVDPQELRAQIAIASGTHMASPVEVRSEAELTSALAAGARTLVLSAFKGRALSLDFALALLPKVPRTVSALIRGPFANIEDLAPLRGLADGIWVAGPLMRAIDPAAFLRPLVEAAENG